MSSIRRLVVDVLKPHSPTMPEFAKRVAGLEAIEGVTASLIELDQEVQNVKLTIEGDDLDVDAVERRIRDIGGTVHSIDQVACGQYIVEDRQTPQDA